MQGSAKPIQLGRSAEQLLYVSIEVDDVAGARSFYTSVIGLREIPGSWSEAPAQGGMLSFGGGYDEAFLSLRRGEPRDHPRTPVRLVFKVLDVMAVVGRARSAGWPVVVEPGLAHGISGSLVSVIRDPDGNEVEVVRLPSTAPGS
jgi:catechol 2,3-dioxygenase-like lactoylglutathione lyase family enzyme